MGTTFCIHSESAAQQVAICREILGKSTAACGIWQIGEGRFVVV